MEVSMKNLMVYPDKCSSNACASCYSSQCQLCSKCLSQEAIDYLKAAYIEHNNRQDCKRIFPPPVSDVSMKLYLNKVILFASSFWLIILYFQMNFENQSIMHYSPDNSLLMLWFKGKCELDKDWCWCKVLVC